MWLDCRRGFTPSLLRFSTRNCVMNTQTTLHQFARPKIRSLTGPCHCEFWLRQDGLWDPMMVKDCGGTDAAVYQLRAWACRGHMLKSCLLKCTRVHVDAGYAVRLDLGCDISVLRRPLKQNCFTAFSQGKHGSIMTDFCTGS